MWYNLEDTGRALRQLLLVEVYNMRCQASSVVEQSRNDLQLEDCQGCLVTRPSLRMEPSFASPPSPTRFHITFLFHFLSFKDKTSLFVKYAASIYLAHRMIDVMEVFNSMASQARLPDYLN